MKETRQGMEYMFTNKKNETAQKGRNGDGGVEK